MQVSYEEGEADELQMYENIASLPSASRYFAMSGSYENAENLTASLPDSIYNCVIKAGESAQGRAAFLHGTGENEPLILVVKNPYAHDLKYSEAGELLTTKKDSQRHGYGLKSIKRTAERYFGEVLTDGKGRVFTLTVILNLPQMTAQNSSSGLCGSGRK